MRLHKPVHRQVQKVLMQAMSTHLTKTRTRHGVAPLKLYVEKMDISGLRLDISIDAKLDLDQLDTPFLRKHPQLLLGIGARTVVSAIMRIHNCPLNFHPLHREHM